MKEENRIALFLGSGATAGSGIRKNGISLPTDSQFFDKEKGCPKIIADWEDGYPALKLCRDEIPTIKLPSLYQTWNQLFIFRGLARANLCENKNLIQKFKKLKNHKFPNGYQWRAEHYEHHFESMRLGWSKLYFSVSARWLDKLPTKIVKPTPFQFYLDSFMEVCYLFQNQGVSLIRLAFPKPAV